MSHCEDCGSAGHDTGSDTCPGPGEQDRLEDPNARAHDCLEHLKYELHEWTETHGLDCGPYEHCSQEIWRCTLCGEVFSASDLERAKQ